MRGTARQHGFLHIGANLVAKGVLGQMGQIHPFSTCIEGKSAIFQNKDFPSNPSWIMCRWTLQGRWAPPEHPRDASHVLHAYIGMRPMAYGKICIKPP